MEIKGGKNSTSAVTSEELLLPEFHVLRQRSPTFLAPGTGFVEDNFFVDRGEAGVDGSGGNGSDGERQMKLRSLARRSPPAVWPRS